MSTRKHTLQCKMVQFTKLQCLLLLGFIPVICAKDFSEKSNLLDIESFENHYQKGRSTYATIEERMDLHDVPGMSIAVIQNAQLLWAKGYGVIQVGSSEKVNTQTVFSVGSISKVVAAAITLRLVNQKQLNLNQNVNDYLSSWKVPQNNFTKKQVVTLKHILSHTAGFNIHGFKDFLPNEDLPNTIETLMGIKPAKHDPVNLEFVPGTAFKYSGGGVTVEQLVIEEIMSLPFVDAAKTLLFNPLGMKRSTFQNPIPEDYGNIAKAHNHEGTPRALPRGWEAMPEMAASGLWSTPSDIALLMIALMDSYNGNKPSFINHQLAQDMMTQVAPGTFGLGPHISQDQVFSHGGANDSYKAHMMGDLKTGHGIVILTNGANGTRIVNEVIDTFKRIAQP